MSTKIEWTEETWNPVTGCDKVSPGCDHCYAETIAHRFAGSKSFPDGFAVTLHPDRLEAPLRWRKPRRVFVNSMSDLFHEQIPDTYIANVFAIMALAPRHTFQILTKRHGRMRSLLNSDEFRAQLIRYLGTERWLKPPDGTWPLRNVWLGVSAEDQKWADIRIPSLLNTSAAVRFVSAEPLLGRIDLAQSLAKWTPDLDDPLWDGHEFHARDVLHWVIAGGESGRGARPMHPNWARLLRDQCQTAGVSFFFKQRGEWTWNEPGHFVIPSRPYTDRVAVMHGAGMTAMTKDNPFNPFERGHPHWATRIERVGKRRAGRLLDGRTWDEYPEPGSVSA